MKNFKKTGWIEEIQHRLDQKLGKNLYYTGSIFLVLKKEKS